MRALLKLSSAIDRLTSWVGRATSWLALLMVLIGVYNATVRYLGRFVGRNLSSNAYLELQWYLFGAVFMLGAAYALQRNGHVRVDIFYGSLSARGQAWVDLLGGALFLVPFCALTLWLSLDWVGFSWQIHEMSSDPEGLPRYPIKTVVPVALGLLLLQGVSQVVKAIGVLHGDLAALDPKDLDGEAL